MDDNGTAGGLLSASLRADDLKSAVAVLRGLRDAAAAASYLLAEETAGGFSVVASDWPHDTIQTLEPGYPSAFDGLAPPGERATRLKVNAGFRNALLTLMPKPGKTLQLDRPAATALLASYAWSGIGPDRSAGTQVSLSERERECLHWVSEGKTAGEVSQILGVSVNTVNRYILHATQKLGADNRSMAIALALRQNLIAKAGSADNRPPLTRKGTDPHAVSADLSFRKLSDTARAQSYALFFSGRVEDRFWLQAVADSSFPRMSKLSRRVAAGGLAELEDRILLSSRPFDIPAALLLELSGASEEPGIAFPLHAGHRTGLLLLHGDGISAAPSERFALHLEAGRLFEAVTQDPVAAKTMLSNRETDCLRLTARGRTSDEIADQLGLSVHTANQYLTDAIRKLNAVNRTHAMAKAIRSGIIG